MIFLTLCFMGGWLAGQTITNLGKGHKWYSQYWTAIPAGLVFFLIGMLFR